MTMRAWQVTAHGEPDEVLALAQDVAVPEPGPGQVRVAVSATAVNFADVLLCRGEYQVRPDLPFSPGLEVCGRVTATGPDVDHVAVGDRVLGATALPHGGFAQECLLEAVATFAAPEGLDDAAAAALLVSYHTGWLGLHRRAHLQAGEHLLVHAASGGVGSAAVQLGRAAGAHVIGVVGGSDKVAIARELGCDVVIDRREEDLVTRVKEITEGHGADVVYDSVGGPAYDQSTRCIAFEGRIVVVGFAGGRISEARLNHAMVKNYGILGLHLNLYRTRAPEVVGECHEDLVRLADVGQIAPLLGEQLPFGEVPRALTALASGGTTGRMVITAD
ncbi:NADPH:quinone oxidoreductase family protein [Janibacter alkaliphilus]|uniref:NADPH2:quinone reductase n=1 Tax=Janibacter alkaliphilus TaxID=1069963 RepID=A0A852X9W2_9MICO|nr:NADPH:quinone oxidoreductase family protein [Janibacter alkaliphilus]NYG37134.1 NADPH2:quinone reductase [Janibacter alkaliphilus]